MKKGNFLKNTIRLSLSPFASVRLRYWSDYNIAVHELMVRCVESISLNGPNMKFNDDRPKCLACGYHYDLYQCKCPKCYEQMVKQRDQARLKTEHWQTRYLNREATDGNTN